MANYRTHTHFNFCLVPFFLILIWQFFPTQWDRGMTFCLSFLLSTYFFSPDLDLKHSSIQKNWGWLQRIWHPYAFIFRHRGLSHSIFYSAFTKILYFLGLGMIISFTLCFFFCFFRLIHQTSNIQSIKQCISLIYSACSIGTQDFKQNLITIYQISHKHYQSSPHFWQSAFFGLVTADLSHRILDELSSANKRFFKKIFKS